MRKEETQVDRQRQTETNERGGDTGRQTQTDRRTDRHISAAFLHSFQQLNRSVGVTG